jgi:hypothetical protein
MRNLFASLVLAGTLISTGCSSLLSLNPIVKDREAVFDAGLLGTWLDGEDLYILRQSGNNVYTVSYSDKKGSVVKLEGRLVQLGKASILDLVENKPDCVFCIPGHAFVRVWLEGTTLRWAFLDSDWLKSQVSEHKLASQLIGNDTVLTASTDSIKNFMLVYGADDRAYGEVHELRRQ